MANEVEMVAVDLDRACDYELASEFAHIAFLIRNRSFSSAKRAISELETEAQEFIPVNVRSFLSTK